VVDLVLVMPSIMILTHGRKKPAIDPTAYVAPTATVCGDVSIGENCRIMFGACIVAEGGAIEIGAHCIILENAVIRSTSRHSARIGDHCLIGPNAHVTGCTLKDEVFVATGAAVFHGAILKAQRGKSQRSGPPKDTIARRCDCPDRMDRGRRSGIDSPAGSTRCDLEDSRTTQFSPCVLWV